MTKSVVIKPRDNTQPLKSGASIFLAGSIDQGAAENWQEEVEHNMAAFGVTIYNPRRENWLPDLRQDISEPEFAYQVNWELDHIKSSDIVFVYFSPTGKAPITLMELGSLRGRKGVVVCCPEGYWRRGNVQVFCQREGWKLHDTLDRAIDALQMAVI